jgi:hypothetical protein
MRARFPPILGVLALSVAACERQPSSRVTEDLAPDFQQVNFEREGLELFEAACRLDLEGIVAKRKADPYHPETAWYKIKNPALPRAKEEQSCSSEGSHPPSYSLRHVPVVFPAALLAEGVGEPSAGSLANECLELPPSAVLLSDALTKSANRKHSL